MANNSLTLEQAQELWAARVGTVDTDEGLAALYNMRRTMTREAAVAEFRWEFRHGARVEIYQSPRARPGGGFAHAEADEGGGPLRLVSGEGDFAHTYTWE